ncbi:MAG: polyprenyl synthetase family protein [Candidatus Cryptobacteroides sp.]|nr:polyprenyl synthetase family protein [Bacteroidales bacterium]MDY6158226.1 polyprenyl synthetase family protein [Candidatus Cryptobacteroides sp.]
MISEKQICEQVKMMFKDIEFTREPKGLYDPLRYMIEIGGKRVRPSLCLTTYSFFRDEFDEGIISPATALEVFHSFTLMHDDIMDHSPLRRGMPTVWKKWNEDTAILSGDVMLIDAYRRISKAPHEVLGRVMSLFSTTAAQVCDGQQYDMDFESESEVPMEDYRKMIGLKTAVLLACSAEMGAIIGGASEEVCKALYNYGYELGMAFQVADDYLDAFGDEKVFGKPIGGDIVNGKKSWLTVRTLEKTDDREGFLKAFGELADDSNSREAKIGKVKKYYTDCAVDSDAKIEIAGFTWKALEAVSNIGLKPENIEMLRNFAEKLVGRAR